MEDSITLEEWLNEANVTPISVIQKKRGEAEEIFKNTGTNGIHT